MRKHAALLSLLAFALVLAWPAGSSATAPDNGAASYAFLTHPKSASGGGGFTHTFAGGGSASGTWSVDRLVDFQPYGCGVVFGTPLPPDLCGGRVSLDVTFTGPAGSLPGGITIFCVIGSPPTGVEEGVHVDVPGIANFNKQVSGMNVYIKQ